MNISMLTMEQYDNRRPNTVGSSRIRGAWVMKYEPRIKRFEIGEKVDAVIYQKAYYHDHMKQFTGIKVFDLCDPDWLENKPLAELAENVDAFTVTTEAIAGYLRQITQKPVVVIPDRIDPDEHVPTHVRHVGRARTVVWYGYSQNHEMLDQTVDEIHKRGMELVIISDRNYHSGDVFIKYEYPKVHEDIAKYDMILLPDYKNNVKYQYKSNNKTLTAWGLRMPVATSPDDLDRFLSADEREKEAETRLQEVLEKHHVRQSGPEYIKLIEELAKGR